MGVSPSKQQTQPCPRCGAQPGETCVSNTGNPTDPHSIRLERTPGIVRAPRTDPADTETWTTRAGKDITGRRCQARAHGSQEQCERRASVGRDRCKVHGANLPGTIAAAQRQQVEERTQAAVRGLIARGEILPVADPLTALANLAGEVLALKDLFADQVRDMGAVLTQSWEERSVADVAIMREDVRAIVAAYERALDRSVNVLATMVKLDLQGRLVAIREDEATRLVDAIVKGLKAVDMPTEFREAAQAAIAERLDRVAPATRFPAASLER